MTIEEGNFFSLKGHKCFPKEMMCEQKHKALMAIARE